MKYYIFIYFLVEASEWLKGEITTFNNAMRAMLPEIRDMGEDGGDCDIYVRTLAYDDKAWWVDDVPQKIEDYIWNDNWSSGSESIIDILDLFCDELKRFRICKKNIIVLPVLFSSSKSYDDYMETMNILYKIPVFRKGIKIGVSLGSVCSLTIKVLESLEITDFSGALWYTISA